MAASNSNGVVTQGSPANWRLFSQIGDSGHYMCVVTPSPESEYSAGRSSEHCRFPRLEFRTPYLSDGCPNHRRGPLVSSARTLMGRSR